MNKIASGKIIYIIVLFLLILCSPDVSCVNTYAYSSGKDVRGSYNYVKNAIGAGWADDNNAVLLRYAGTIKGISVTDILLYNSESGNVRKINIYPAVKDSVYIDEKESSITFQLFKGSIKYENVYSLRKGKIVSVKTVDGDSNPAETLTASSTVNDKNMKSFATTEEAIAKDNSKAMLKAAAVPEVLRIGTRSYNIYGGRLVLTTGSGNPRVIMKNAYDIYPSTDMKALAVVIASVTGGQKLVVADLDGNIKAVVTDGAQIFGITWSPDSKRLAFSIIKWTGQNKKLAVADALNGRFKNIRISYKYTSEPIRWSPGGKKLMLTAIKYGKTGNEMFTYIIKI